MSQIQGGEGPDVLRGPDGERNTIDGRGGDDEIWGGSTFVWHLTEYNYDPDGSGNWHYSDTYYNFDDIYGGEGNDIIHGDSVEALVETLVEDHYELNEETGEYYLSSTYTERLEPDGDALDGGPGNDTLDGGGGSDRVAGGDGRDRLFGGADVDDLDGGLGVDTLVGGAGDDRLSGGPAADWASYAEDAGGVALDLTAGTATDGWGTRDALSGIEHVIGSQFRDLLRGEGGSNTLKGLGGADSISGAAGDDRLLGGDGADRLIGGLGADRLEGGGAGDKFVFASVAETGLEPGGRDLILDFGQGQGDRIVLQAIDADATHGGNQAFSFIGTGAFTAAGQLRFVQDAAGDRTLVEGNVDADLAPDFRIELTGLHDLTAGDFLL